jgi:Fibronectin type III domain
LPEDVDILEPIQAIDHEEEKEKTAEEIQKAIDEYNPFLARRDPNYVAPVGLTLWTEADDDDDDDSKPSPPEVFDKSASGVVAFTMKLLEPNTLYEFRVICVNGEGMSESSIPSLRAKTRKDAAPGSSRPPNILEVKPTSVVLALDIPPAGGGPIESFYVDIRDCERDSLVTRQFKFIDDKSEFRISGLKSGSIMQFRSRAENRIGQGPSTAWTGELRYISL